MNTYVKFERSDGKIFSMGDNDWTVYKLDGIAAPSIEIFSENKAVGDGDVITGQRIASRTLEFKGRNRNAFSNSVQRNFVLSYFNPKFTYKITVRYLDSERWIQAHLSAVSCPAANTHALLNLSVMFYCNEPFWNSMEDFGQDIASENARFGFPYMCHPVYGTLVSVFCFNRVVNFNYDGDVGGFFKAKLTFDGEVVNPKLVKDEYFVRIIDKFNVGDTIWIDFETGRITNNGENILFKIDRLSTFADVQILIGDNAVSYDADFGNNLMHVSLFYYKRYLGI